MKIVVSRIPPEGLTEHAAYDPSTMDMDRSDIQLKEPFEVDASIVKADQEVVVTAKIRAPLHMTCARCLEEFTSMVTPAAVFSYQAHDADVIDITDDVRQEILLAYPMIPTCRPDCKGLCSVCGQNLNVASCVHRSAMRPSDSAAS